MGSVSYLICLLGFAGVTLCALKNMSGGLRPLNAFTKDATLPLRGFLILLVMLEHVHAAVRPFDFGCGINSDTIPMMGAHAVAVFFFLSGYGLSRAKNGTLRQDLTSMIVRLMRLLIPLGVLSLVFVLAMKWSGRPLRALFDIDGHPMFPHVWFAYALVYLYVMYSVAHLFLRKSWADVAVVCAVGVYYLTTRFVWGWGEWWWMTIFAFPVGIAFAYGEGILIGWIRKVGVWVYVGGLGLFLAIKLLTSVLYRFGCGDLFVRDIALLMLGPLCALAVYVLPVRKGWMAFLGGMTYELYLIHGMLEVLLPQDFMGKVVYSLLVIGGAIPLAFVCAKLNGRMMRCMRGKITL